ncbi:hypothetical protein VNO77_04183 [Canavalia gladiata]|uniref:Uncharacterized protein n=1 Tax=Canavalia gladiata TaxID=3824 RepID=A0AAN9N177_CANGL
MPIKTGGQDLQNEYVSQAIIRVQGIETGSQHPHPSLHLTHVTFSPDGLEVPLSYSREHVYLIKPCVSNFFPNGFPIKKNTAAKLDKCRKLIRYVKKSLDDGAPYYGIEACNEEVKSDAHMAIRDCYAARKIDNSSHKALYYMSEALSQLGRHEEALDFAIASHSLAPSKSEVAERVENGFDSRGGRILSSSDILSRSEATSDASQDGPRSERDDSDYNEELKLDFETSLSGDEGYDLESNILRGSLKSKNSSERPAFLVKERNTLPVEVMMADGLYEKSGPVNS